MGRVNNLFIFLTKDKNIVYFLLGSKSDDFIQVQIAVSMYNTLSMGSLKKLQRFGNHFSLPQYFLKACISYAELSTLSV